MGSVLPRCSSASHLLLFRNHPPPPQLVSVCESASPICLKHSVYRCIPWSSTACLIHFSLTHFQLSQTPTAWCHFNLIYPLPPPPSTPHIKQSDLLFLYGSKKHTSTLTAGPIPSIQNTLPALTFCVPGKQMLPVLQNLLYCRFLPEAFLRTPLLSLLLFTAFVPLFYYCSILFILSYYSV